MTGQRTGRYLAFGCGALVRRPRGGDWSGQGAPEYRTLPPVVDASIGDAVELHLRCHGPSSRHDLAWWSGLGLRMVDQHLVDLADRVELVSGEGPDGTAGLEGPVAAVEAALGIVVTEVSLTRELA